MKFDKYMIKSLGQAASTKINTTSHPPVSNYSQRFLLILNRIGQNQGNLSLRDLTDFLNSLGEFNFTPGMLAGWKKRQTIPGKHLPLVSKVFLQNSDLEKRLVARIDFLYKTKDLLLQRKQLAREKLNELWKLMLRKGDLILANEAPGRRLAEI